MSNTFLLIIFFLSLSTPIKSEKNYEFYLNDFQIKQIKAVQILKDIENNLKNGSRNKICLKQREAGKLGLLALESLIKAYKIKKEKAPIKKIEASKKRWETIKENC